MKLTKPDFYDSFLCIADKCTDNCCIGWEIDIDEAAMARYDSAEGEFAERLRAAINRGECPTFANTAGERCALLREDGLCELVLNMGEDSLCDICALHPRFFEWFNNEKEAGLGLCCEEVCRLLFADREPLKLVSCEINEEAEETVDEDIYGYVKAARERIFSLLSERREPLGVRLLRCCRFVREVQEALDNGVFALPEVAAVKPAPDPERFGKTLSALLRELAETEPINGEWTARIGELCEHANEISAAFPAFLRSGEYAEYRYEKLAAYTVYRWFLKGAFDGEVVSKIGFACAFVTAAAAFDCFTWLKNGRLSEWDCIVNVKLLSKQTEYSDEVKEALFDAVWTEGLSPERLCEGFLL